MKRENKNIKQKNLNKKQNTQEEKKSEILPHTRSKSMAWYQL